MDYLLNGLPYFPGTTIFGTGLFDNGTAAAPSISFASQSGLGVYRLGSGILGFVSGGGGLTLNLTTGTPKFSAFNYAASIAIQDAVNGNITLTPSGTGGVLIGGGTLFPYTAGALALNINAASSAQSEIKLTNSTTGNSATAGMMLSCAGNDAYVWNGQATGALYFGTANATRALFLANGRFLIGTSSDSGARLQLGTNSDTTIGGGQLFGTDTGVYRISSGNLAVDHLGGTAPKLTLSENSVVKGRFESASGDVFLSSITAGKSLILRSGAEMPALTLDASQRTILSGALRLNNAYVAGAVVGTGYVTIQDSTGTTYRIPVLV